MARPTHPRRRENHRLVAGEVLLKHQRITGWEPILPVPIDMIVERTYGLSISWDEIPEPAGYRILGALSPRDRTIVMNIRHLDMFEQWMGPARFTLAHELAHWLYDAGNPDQQALAFDTVTEVFCRKDDTSDLDPTTQLRERNANALASHILLPDDLVLAGDLDAVLDDIRGTAYEWGVSKQTLTIKLEGLGLLGDGQGDDLFQ